MDISKFTRLLDLVKNTKQHWAVTIALAIIATGGLTHIFGLWEAGWAREDSYLRMYRTELIEHAQTRQELLRCKSDLSILNGNIIEFPFPFWIKNVDSKIVYLNDAYEELILTPNGISKLDILGTTGEMMSNEESVKQWILNDQIVLRTGRRQKVKETAIGFNGYSWKFPVYKSGKIVLLGGFFIPDEEFTNN